MKKHKQVLLCILDGWGMENGKPGDTISLADLPNYWRYREEGLFTQISPSGLDVGLPAGQMGNSEVGHLNIGAGRVVYQDLTRIDKAIADGDFYDNLELNRAIDAALAGSGRLHIMGLLSDGGVHSHIDHLLATLKLAKRRGVLQVFIHCFLDGRDVPPDSALGYIKSLEEFCDAEGCGSIATVCGRYYAMDRDKRYDRVERAWRCLTHGEGVQAVSAYQAVQQSYERGVFDEFVEPIAVNSADGAFNGAIRDGDSVIFYNFRADRARELTNAFTDADFDGFTRDVVPNIHFCCFTLYDINIKAPVAFAQQDLVNTLGEVIAAHGLSQLRIAETEKYAHVTFFFNGGVEQPNQGEDRVLIPSPKVATYDLKPEMSAFEVTEALLAKVREKHYDLIVLNFANADMVGHTGIIPAAKQAVEAVDKCLGRLVEDRLADDTAVIITADHGNVECMLDEAGHPVTSHTNGPVPFIVLGTDGAALRSGGSLRDIAPTVLALLGIEQPAEMTGSCLIE